LKEEIYEQSKHRLSTIENEEKIYSIEINGLDFIDYEEGPLDTLPQHDRRINNCWDLNLSIFNRSMDKVSFFTSYQGRIIQEFAFVDDNIYDKLSDIWLTHHKFFIYVKEI
jgi:hypothetical protein